MNQGLLAGKVPVVGSRRLAAVLAAVAVAAVPVMLGDAGVALAASRPLTISPTSAGWTWSLGQTVPGVPALGPGEFTTLGLIACASEGNCAAAGTFNTVDSFLVNEVAGVWRTAIPIPGMATLSPGGQVTIRSLAYGSPGNCSAVGWYQAWNDVIQGFVVSEVNGTWHDAMQVPARRGSPTPRRAAPKGTPGDTSPAAAGTGAVHHAGTMLKCVTGLPSGTVIALPARIPTSRHRPMRPGASGGRRKTAGQLAVIGKGANVLARSDCLPKATRVGTTGLRNGLANGS